jgi:hypothetical protein
VLLCKIVSGDGDSLSQHGHIDIMFIDNSNNTNRSKENMGAENGGM